MTSLNTKIQNLPTSQNFGQYNIPNSTQKKDLKSPLATLRKSVGEVKIKKPVNNDSHSFRIENHYIKKTGKKLKTKRELSSRKNTVHTYCGLPAKTGNISIKQNDKSFFWHNLTSCKCIWRCPTCSHKLLTGRAKELYKIASQHQLQNPSYKMGFITLTIRHKKADSLKSTQDKLLTGYRKMQQHAFFKNIKSNFLIGQIKSVEHTHSDKNGWHPHLHILYFYKTDNQEIVENIHDKIISKWAQHTNSTQSGQDAQIVYTQNDIINYITKWNVVKELTSQNSKQSKGLNPFQILQFISKNENNQDLKTDVQKYKSLWLEYVEATKGKRRITTSPALNTLYNIQLKSDETIIQEAHEGETVIQFKRELFSLIYENDLQPHILNICHENHTNHKKLIHEIKNLLNQFEHIKVHKFKHAQFAPILNINN